MCLVMRLYIRIMEWGSQVCMYILPIHNIDYIPQIRVITAPETN